MLEKTELLKLMKATAKADPSNPVAYSYNGENLSYEALNETLRNELNEYAGTYALYRENKNTIFELIEQTMNDILPKTVVQNYGQFAEVKTFAQGDKPIFIRQGTDNTRAKQFITKVGLAGVYEVFKLGKERPFELQTSAMGGAAEIGFEEFLDGRVDFAELTRIVMEGMDELVYREIGEALKEAIASMPVANQAAFAGFDEVSFDRLLAVAGMYGTPQIYCTYEFATRMVPAGMKWGEPGGNWVPESAKQERWEKGYFATYKGHRVVILPQGFTDETNSEKIIDPGYCWIIPGAVKPVKVAFEGDTLVREWENRDWSREIQVYRKVGVGVLTTNNVCMYIDTSLQGQMGVMPSEDGTYAGMNAPYWAGQMNNGTDSGDSGNTNPDNP